MKRILFLCLATFASLSMTACTASTLSEATSDVGVIESHVALDSAAMPAEVAAQADLASAGSYGASPVIHTGYATIITDDPGKAAGDFTAYTKEIGGRVDNTWQDRGPSGTMTSVTARVPAEKFDEALLKLSDFGEVDSRGTNAEDVGLQMSDLQARKTALEASVKRIKELMEQADTTEAVIQAESELASRQAELDGVVSQLDWLSDQVEMSTLTVTFQTPGANNQPDTGVWDAFLASLKYLGYGIIVAIPWVIVLGIVAWIAITVVKRQRKRALLSQTSAPSHDSPVDLSPVSEDAGTENHISQADTQM